MKPALIGLPFDENSSFMRGAAGAPPLIRDAFFSPASNRFSESGIDLGANAALLDAGDEAPASTDEMPATVESSIEALLRHGYQPLSLGGDHSITYPIMKPISRSWPGVAILHFDAHPDLYDVYDSNRLSRVFERESRRRYRNEIHDADDSEGIREGSTGHDAEAVAAMMEYNESLQKAGVLLSLDGLHQALSESGRRRQGGRDRGSPTLRAGGLRPQ